MPPISFRPGNAEIASRWPGLALPDRLRAAGLAGLGAILAAGAILASLSADAPWGSRLRFAFLNALIIVIPIAVGLWATRYPAHRAFGRLLIAAGVIWSTAALAEADLSVLYSLGRISGWLTTTFLLFLVLAYPSGRLTAAVDRALFGAMALNLCLVFLPTALMVDRYPTRTPWSSCRADCPANAFMLLDRQPAFIDSWLVPTREALVLTIVCLAVGVLAVRVGRATHLQRQTLAPVLASAAALCVLLIAFVTARRANAAPSAVDIVGWLAGLCIPAIALGFLIGLMRWRLYVGRALGRLTVAMRRPMTPPELRHTLSSALEDPSLRLVYRNDHEWLDEVGRPAAGATSDSRRAWTELGDDESPLAALDHDAALCDDQEFLAAVGQWTLTAVEGQRALVTVDAGLEEIEQSRARLAADANTERRRIERDLHEGAQQRLVALRIRLELAANADGREAGADQATLRALGAEVGEILEDLRSLAVSVYPPRLADQGLAGALRSAALLAPLPTDVHAGPVGRHSEEIETAVYFVCLEALQNAVKHAAGATAVSIRLHENGALRFEVRDDGAGFREATAKGGSGITNMHDRLAAIGGTLTVDSAPGRGTRIIGTVPLA